MNLTAKAQIWIHSSEYPPHTPTQFSACEWYGHLSLLEAFLETDPRDLDIDLRMDEWLDVELTFSYEEGYDGACDFCLQKITLLQCPEGPVQENHDLRAVLEELVDLQNGPPLPSYQQEWSEVMRKAYELLGREPAPYLGLRA